MDPLRTASFHRSHDCSDWALSMNDTLFYTEFNGWVKHRSWIGLRRFTAWAHAELQEEAAIDPGPGIFSESSLTQHVVPSTQHFIRKSLHIVRYLCWSMFAYYAVRRQRDF